MKTKKILPWIAIAAAVAAIVIISDVAMAEDGLTQAAAKAAEIQGLVMKILRSLYIVCGGIVAYAWFKGSAHAREKTEMFAVGLIVAATATELINAFVK